MHTHKQALKRLCFYTSRNIRKKENKQQIWRKKCQNMKMSPKWHILAQVTHNAGEQGTQFFCLFFKNKNKSWVVISQMAGWKDKSHRKLPSNLGTKCKWKPLRYRKPAGWPKQERLITNDNQDSHIFLERMQNATPTVTLVASWNCNSTYCMLSMYTPKCHSSKTTGIVHADNVYSILFISFFEMVSLCSPGWPGLVHTM